MGLTRCGVGALGLAIGLLVGPVARADEPTRALFVATGLGSDDGELLRDAISRELSLELLDAEGAEGRLSELAGRLPDDPTDRRVERAEREALSAYLHLRFGPAESSFDEALTSFVGRRRGTPDPATLSRLLFGRALVRLAARREADARTDLQLALALDPELSPDPTEYGPPIMRAIRVARTAARRARPIELRIDAAPEDAIVRVDGAQVQPGEAVRVTGGARHLLTVERVGYVPQTKWVDVPRRGEHREAVVLERAEGPLLAFQALEAWRAASGGDDPRAATMPPDVMPLVARSLSATRVVGVSRAGPNELVVVLRDAGGEVLGQASGGRIDWEPSPYAVLAASLAGRTLTPPPPSDVAITVSAPSRVGPSETILFRVTLRDGDQRVERLAASCGRLQTELAVEDETDGLSLALTAPDAETTLRCDVRALDADGRALARAPEALEVEVVEAASATPWYGLWYVWGAVGVAVAAGVTAGILAAGDDGPPPQSLRIHGP